MIIYGTIEKQEMRLDYVKLAEKMWFHPKDGKDLEINHGGGNEMLQMIFHIHLGLPKWIYDQRWQHKALTSEFLKVDPVSTKEMKELEFSTEHEKVLTVDRRAFYIMILTIVSEVNGMISEDGRQTWITPQAFQQKHQAILSLSYDEANEISLTEVDKLDLKYEESGIACSEEDDDYLITFWDNIAARQKSLLIQPERIGMKIDHQALAQKMWPQMTTDKLDVIDYGKDVLRDHFYLALKLKDAFQQITPTFKIPKYFVLSSIDEEEPMIEIYTTFTEITLQDLRVFYIMANEIIKLTGGSISEDKGKTWLSLGRFQKKHSLN